MLVVVVKGLGCKGILGKSGGRRLKVLDVARV